MKRNLAFLLALVLLAVQPVLASSYGDHAVTSVVPGTGATNEGKAEDAASASADTIIPIGAPRQDTVTNGSNGTDVNPTSAAGDYGTLTVNRLGHLKVQVEPSSKNAYRAASATFVPAASATDVAEIIGSATKKVIITKFIVAYSATVGATHTFYLVKRGTAANSAGTSTAPTAVPMDTGPAVAATAALKVYTANPTLGTLVGQVATFNNMNNTSGIASCANIYAMDCAKGDPPIVLRSATETLALNSGGVTVAGTSPILAITVEWYEE